jgi:hypothetical protein
MTTNRLQLHDIVDGLIKLNGVSTQEAAVRSGISPGAVGSLRTRSPTQVVTWCRMISALGCSLVIENQGQSWSVDAARPSPPLIDREWRAWRQRRMVSALHTIGDRRLKRAERDAKARQYITNEEGRLRERLAELKSQIKQLAGQHRATTLRQAIRLLSDKLELKAEELALLAGVNLGAAQVALGDDGDGRLITIHRLLSAMNGRLHIEMPARGAIDIVACAPGTWRLGDREEDDAVTARTTKVATNRITNRSTLDSEHILKLYDADMSIGEIARKAGISRQRVHKIAMDHGRTPRRVSAKERRISEGMGMLGY